MKEGPSPEPPSPRTSSTGQLPLVAGQGAIFMVRCDPPRHGCSLKIFPESCGNSERKSNCGVKAHDAIPNQGSGTMKKLTAILMGILFVAATALVCTTSAIAAPPGHHGGHHGNHHRGHRAHWGFGSGILVGSSPVVVDDDCYMVKRCYINQFGVRRCRWIQTCD